jgi:hypothetical protein
MEMKIVEKKEYVQKLNLLDIFVLSSALTIIGIRVFLELTGYPQIGGNGLHVAHMLWGGLGMLVVMLYLLLVKEPNRYFAALVGGVGFGFFIDEIGKFVTSDNNYFFEPTAFLIYTIILATWVGVRYAIVRRSQGSFLSPAQWPTHSYFGKAIRVYVVLSIVFGVFAVIGAFIQGDSILGFRNSLENYLILLTGAVALIYLVGLSQYRKDKIQAASTIRTGTMISTVGIYPFTFYDKQFAAAFGCAIAVLVILGLSEASLKGILMPLFKKHDV